MDNVELIQAGYDAFVRRDREWLYANVTPVGPLDDDRVLGVVRFRGTATSTGMEVEQVFGQVFTARDGKVGEMRSYSSKEQALAAIAAETKLA
jgi:ketosteroid isomerase-like protein